MGLRKKNRTGPAMDAHFVEGLLQYFLNMVWIALGRTSSREIGNIFYIVILYSCSVVSSITLIVTFGEKKVMCLSPI